MSISVGPNKNTMKDWMNIREKTDRITKKTSDSKSEGFAHLKFDYQHQNLVNRRKKGKNGRKNILWKNIRTDTFSEPSIFPYESNYQTNYYQNSTTAERTQTFLQCPKAEETGFWAKQASHGMKTYNNS